MNNLIRVIWSIIRSFKFLTNPWVIFDIPCNRSIILIPKVGDRLVIKNRQFIDFMSIFNNGWCYNDGIFDNSKCKLKVPDPYILTEDFVQMYKVGNINGKNVLDIGGLYGESAIIILKELGVNKVFVYEPIKENYELIKFNVMLNNADNAIETFNLGVSFKSGSEIVRTDEAPGNAGFGMPGVKFETTIDVVSWDDLLYKHKNDDIFLAKVDCEGAEKFLIQSNKELVKMIPNWIIETHSLEIEKSIINLFKSLGYHHELREEMNKKMNVNVWYFSSDEN